MKISTKTSLLIVSMVVALFVPLSSVMLRFQERHLRRITLQGLDAMAGNSALLLSTFVDDGQRKALAIAATIPRQELEWMDRETLSEHLQTMFDAMDFTGGIFLLDARGTLVVDAPVHPAQWGSSRAGRDYFKRTMDLRRGVMSGPYVSERSGTPLLTFTAPILDRHGSVLAMVGCSYSLIGPGLLRTIREQRIGRTGNAFLFDRTRLLILHPDAGRMLHRDIPPGAYPLFDLASQGFQGAGETSTSSGVVLASFRQVPGTPWILCFQVPRHEAFESIAGFGRLMLAGTAVSLLTLLGAALLAVRRLTRPITRLHRAVQTLARLPDGPDLGTDPLPLLESIRSSDEIGAFAGALGELLRAKRHSIGLLQRAASEWEMTFDAVAEAILCLDEGGRILRINRTAADWFRIAPGAAVGLEGRSLLAGEAAPGAFWPDPTHLDARHPLTWSGPLPGRDGVFEFKASPLAHGGAVRGMTLAVRDITDHERRVEDMRKQAFFDHLTGLPNRIMLNDRLEHALARGVRSRRSVAVLFLDLDHFKEINDTRGHAAGDELLRGAAQRMAEVTRKGDTVARLGGDEFVMVLSDLGGPEDAIRVAEKVIHTLSQPFSIAGASLGVGTSIGIALAPADATQAAALLQHADSAMYAAKRGGRSTYRLYSALAGGAGEAPKG